MEIHTLQLIHFRNYTELNLELPPRGALFVGKNGAGKTNILEALSFLILGKSPRTNKMNNMIQNDTDEAYIYGEFSSGKEQSVGFSRNRDIHITIDKKIYTTLFSLYTQDNNFVYLGPGDIHIITGSPRQRRYFIDQVISQNNIEYLKKLMELKTVTRQKNSLLQGRNDDVLLDIYDKKTAALSAFIMNKRHEYISNIKDSIYGIYGDISDNDMEIELTYTPSFSSFNEDDIFILLQNARSKDREKGFSRYGVHRDDMVFSDAGKNIVYTASQGQCRSVALSLKTATIDYFNHYHSIRPIIAVDDAFSDLDVQRKIKFYEYLKDAGQVFIALHTEKESSYYSLPVFSVFQGTVI
ncbi:MAG: DNA replication/repair protein RecF [Fibrobacterota bacterium]